MAEQPVVRPGQVWADNDKRAAGRQVKVLRLDSRPEHPPFHNGGRDRSRTEEVWYATCEVVKERPMALGRTLGRRVEIRLDRFRPTSTGYRLVKDA